MGADLSFIDRRVGAVRAAAWGASVRGASAVGMRYGPADPTALVAARLPCSARVRRGPHELASLRQHVALIRQTLRASAAQKGSTNPHRIPPADVDALVSRSASAVDSALTFLRSFVAVDGLPVFLPLPLGEGRGEGCRPQKRACRPSHPQARCAVRVGRSLLRRRAAQCFADQGHMLFERSEFMWTPRNASSAGQPRSGRRSRVARPVPRTGRSS